MNNEFKAWLEEAKPVRPNIEHMTKNISQVFLALKLAEKDIIALDTEIRNDSGVRMLLSRASAMQLEISDFAAAFIVLLAQTPGNIVIYLSVLKSFQLKHQKKITMTELAYSFPNGFYTEDHLTILWRLQKTDNGRNLLDMLTLDDFK